MAHFHSFTNTVTDFHSLLHGQVFLLLFYFIWLVFIVESMY